MSVLNEAVLSEIEAQVNAVDLTDMGGYQVDRTTHRLAYRVITVLGVQTDFEGMCEMRGVIDNRLSKMIESNFDDEY